LAIACVSSAALAASSLSMAPRPGAAPAPPGVGGALAGVPARALDGVAPPGAAAAAGAAAAWGRGLPSRSAAMMDSKDAYRLSG